MDSVAITHSSFTNNVSTRLTFGFGGVLEMSAKSFDIEANEFSHNAGGEGMFQVFYVTGADPLSKALIANNTFSWNTAAAIGLSGALELLTGSASPGTVITVQGNTFAHNDSPVYGGALFLHGKSDFLVGSNTFTHNSAGVGGSAVYVNHAKGSITISNGQFVQNAVSGTPIPLEFLNFQAGFGTLFSPALQEGGGAIAIDDGSNVQIQASMFNGNTAPFGGAISVVGYAYLEGPPWDYNDGLPDFSKYAMTNRAASATISNSRFLNNQATTGDGGAIFSGAVITPEVPFQGGTFPAITTFSATAVTVTGGSFRQDTTPAKGGAIAGEQTTASVAQNTFFKDGAMGGGDHAYFASSMVNSYSSSTQAANALQSLLSTNSFRKPDASGIVLQ